MLYLHGAFVACPVLTLGLHSAFVACPVLTLDLHGAFVACPVLTVDLHGAFVGCGVGPMDGRRRRRHVINTMTMTLMVKGGHFADDYYTQGPSGQRPDARGVGQGGIDTKEIRLRSWVCAGKPIL